MRVLFLSQAFEVKDQPDYDASLKAAHFNGEPIEVRNLPFKGYIREHGEEAFYREVLRINEEFKPHLVFFQFYHSGGDAGIDRCCKDLKAADNSPLIFGSIGDPFYTGWRKHFARPLPQSALDLARNADAFFSTSMGNVAEELARGGGKNIIFLPNAFCPEHFPDWEEKSPGAFEYDIVMLCTKGRLLSRRLVFSVQNNWRRRYVVKMLASEFGARFSVFGRNWKLGSAAGTVPFKEQVRLYQKSRVVVDAPAPILSTTYYSSDRAFFMLGSGTPMIHFHTPRFEKMFRPNEHAYYTYRLRDVCSACKKALDVPDDVRDERRRSIQSFVKERHLISHRVDTIMSTAEALLARRAGNLREADALRHIRMWHFLPEVDLEEEYKYCVLNWVG